jgi:2-polyprenyl-3-methyl-5-hydroxy-6-metoxy-1,4-benzoquinol methylase
MSKSNSMILKYFSSKHSHGQKKTLILHVGMGKTGTTALQNFFWRNRDVLAHHDIAYPETGAVSGAHHLISPHVSKRMHYPGWHYMRPAEWIGTVKRLPQNRILMSSELMVRSAPQKILDFCKELQSHFDLKICFYLRRQDNIIMAGYNQQVKTGSQIKPLPVVLDKLIEGFDYVKLISPWEAAVGADNLIIRPYERKQFYQGDLVRDFLWFILRIDDVDGFSFETSENPNPRFSAATLEFKRRVNNIFRNQADSNQFNKALIEYSILNDKKSQEFYHEQDTLTYEQRQYILNKSAPANSYIAKKYLGREDGVLFYDNPAPAKETGGQPSVDEAEIVRILKYLKENHAELYKILNNGITTALQSDFRRVLDAAKSLAALETTSGETQDIKSVSFTETGARHIIIHPGMPKTGTTAIQQAFFKNRETLLRNYFILYPGVDENHTKPILALFRQDAKKNVRFEGMSLAELDVYREKVRVKMEKEISSSKWHTLIISGEGIATLKKEEWREFIDWLLNFANDVHVIFSVRSPVDMSRSTIQENLKLGFRFEDMRKDPPVFRARKLIQPVLNLLGHEFVDIWNFDEAIKDLKGMIYNFCAQIGLPPDVCNLISLTPTTRNESLSMAAIEELAQRNRKLPSRKSLSASEFLYFRSLQGGTFDIDDSTKEIITRKTDEDVNWLKSVFSDRFNNAFSNLRSIQYKTEMEYVDHLRNNPSLYSKAIEKESEHWGNEFSNEAKKSQRIADQKASQQLGIDSDLSLKTVLEMLPLPLKRGLSLACGSGHAERDFINKNICKNIHGIDVSEAAIEEAKRLSEGMPITYEVGDLNKITLEHDKYDLVIAQSCLHHIIELEHLAEQIAGCLKTDGYLWIHDYIGESQFQYSDEKIFLANRIIECLPDKYRYDSIHKRSIPPVTRRPIGKLASPFEAIRSADIMPVFLKYFDIIVSFESNAVFHLLCPKGTREEFNKTEEGRELVKDFLELDRLILKYKIIQPSIGKYLLKKK